MPTGSQAQLPRCRGFRRFGHCLNKGFRVQAPDDTSTLPVGRAMPTGSQAQLARCRGFRRMCIKPKTATREQAPGSRLRFIHAWLYANAQTDFYIAPRRNHLALTSCRGYLVR